VDLTPATPVAHETGAFEDAEVVGDRRLRNAGLVGQGAHRLLPVSTEALEERAPSGVAERRE
jgi:hypothetical protein